MSSQSCSYFLPGVFFPSLSSFLTSVFSQRLRVLFWSSLQLYHPPLKPLQFSKLWIPYLFNSRRLSGCLRFSHLCSQPGNSLGSNWGNQGFHSAILVFVCWNLVTHFSKKKKIISCSSAYSSYCSIFSVSFLELFQRLIYTCCDPFIYFSLFLLFPLGFPTHHSIKKGQWHISHQMKWSLSPYLPCRHS